MSTLSVGRRDGEGGDWPAALVYANAKQMKLLAIHIPGCLGTVA